jgi:hypothetical protein
MKERRRVGTFTADQVDLAALNIVKKLVHPEVRLSERLHVGNI